VSRASSPPRYLWSDAWFLTAVASCGGDAVTLASVIATADAIEIAIISREEVNGALGRLGRGGYVTRRPDGTIELTASGRSLVRTARDGAPLAWKDGIEALLGAEPWTSTYDPRRAADGEAEQVSQAEYDAALRSRTSRGAGG
jgi:hypothetical protein